MKFTFYCSKYEHVRKAFFQKIKEVEKIDLNQVNKINNMKNPFYQGSLKALNVLGKFVREAFQIREASDNKSDITIRDAQGKLVKSISHKSLTS